MNLKRRVHLRREAVKIYLQRKKVFHLSIDGAEKFAQRKSLPLLSPLRTITSSTRSSKLSP